MTLHTLLSYISLATALFTGVVRPYVYQVDHWSNGTQDLYCLQDYHDEIPVSIKQRKDLIMAAHDGQSLIIVEDMAGYVGDHPALTHYIAPWNSAQPDQQFLLHITTQAHDQAIPVCNVEFRQPTVGGIEGAQISAKDVLDRAEAIEQEVYTYSDGDPFDSYYTSVLHKWESSINKPIKEWFAPIRKSDRLFCKAVQSLSYVQNIGTILAPYQVDALSDSVQKNLVCKLYNSELLDIRIVHALAQGQKHKTVYLCAGSGHIKRIQSFLPKAGYTYLNSYCEGEHEQGVDLVQAFQSLQKAAKISLSESQMHTPVQKTFPAWLIAVLALFLLGSIAYRKGQLLFGLIFLLSAVENTVSAYVTEMQVWSNGAQTITCLSDGHFPTPLSINQTNEFIDQVCKDKESSVVIIEDILAYDGENEEVTRALNAFKQPELHFLPHLTKNCKSSGIQACSIEFRNSHYASRCGAHITGKQVYEVADYIRSQLATYDDGSAFNRCYKKYQQDLAVLHEHCGAFVDQFRVTDMPLVDAIPASKYSHDLDKIVYQYKGQTDLSPQYKKGKILQIYDAPLIDILILHELAQHADKKHIFICAGGWHVDNLASSFKELGYTKIWNAHGVNGIKGQPDFPQSVEIRQAFENFSKQYSSTTIQAHTASTPLAILLVLLCLVTIPLIIRHARKQWLYAFLLAGTTSTLLPYVCHTSTWKKGNQHIHFYSDDHYPHPIGKEHREYVLSRAQQSNSVVIVEDMKNYNGDNFSVRQAMNSYADWEHRFLMNMTEECQERGIPVVNVEFRQPSNASLAGYNVSAGEVIQLSDNLKEKIKTFNDTPEYNRWYAQVLDELEYHQKKYESFFKQLRGKHQTLCALLPKIKYYPSLDKALQDSMDYVPSHLAAKKDELITMYDAALLDILILHALAQYPDAQDVHICAGGWHIANIKDAFESFGYQCISSQDGTLAMQEPDLPDAVEFIHMNTKSQQNTGSYNSMFGYGALLLMVFILISLFMFSRYTLALILLSTLSTTMQAHIFKVDKWTHEDQSHNLFTLRDFHTSRLPMNHKGNEQRNAIVELGKERRAQIIVEDIYPDAPILFKDPINYDPNKIGPMEDKTPFKDKTTPLLALTPACSEHGVKFDNIEFRQVGYVSDMGHIITPADCVRSVNRIATEIKGYDDTEILNEYYARQLKKYNTMQSQAQSFFDYLLTITDKTTKELFEGESAPFSSGIDTALKTFGWNDQRITTTSSTDKMIAILRYYTVPLVDAKLAHALYEHRSNPNLIVCAGFKHIEAIEDILPALGYRHVGTQGKDIFEDPLPEPTALDIQASFEVLDPHPILPSYDTSFGMLFIVAILFGFGFTLSLRRKRA